MGLNRGAFSATTPVLKRLLAINLAAAGLFVLTGCQAPPTPSQPSQLVKPGVELSTQPQTPQEVEDIRPELITLVKEGRITADEARNWLIEAKRRVGIPNPEKTVGFDKMMKEAGVN